MKINVDLEKIDLDTVVESTVRVDYDGDPVDAHPTTLGDVITARAVEKLVQEVARGRDEYPSPVQRVRTLRAEMIKEALAPVIQEALSQPLVRTNSFGEATGPSVTLRELVIQQAQEMLLPPKDPYGRRGSEPTMLQKLIREEIGQAFRNEVSALIKDEKEKAIAAVRESAATIIADAIRAGIGR